MSKTMSGGAPHPSTTKGRYVRKEQLDDLKNLNLTAQNIGTKTELMKSARLDTDTNFDHIVFRKSNDPIPYPLKSLQYTANKTKLTPVDLLPLIQERLLKQRYYIRNLFHQLDTYQQGFITRSSLLKVFCTLCPQIKVEQFHEVLAMTRLDELTMISYDDFEHYLLGKSSDSEIKPIVPVSLVKSGQGRNLSVAFAHQLLRERLFDEGIDPHTIFPGSCFFTDPPGVIVRPQLQEALKLLDINMTPLDFAKLWNRFDKEGVGSIDFQEFMSDLKKGHQRYSKSAPTKIKSDTSRKPRVPLRFYDNPHKAQTNREESAWLNSPSDSPTGRYAQRLELLTQRRPKLSDLLQMLQYIFEEAYYGMLVTIKRHVSSCSTSSKELIAIPEMTRILIEYNLLQQTAGDDEVIYGKEDNFMKSPSCKMVSDLANQLGACERNGTMINYEKMLNRLVNRSSGSLSHQMWSELRQKYKDPRNIRKAPCLCSVNAKDDLIKNFMEFLHHEYWKFLSLLEQNDHGNTGHIAESNLRPIIQTVIGYQETTNQWQEFLQRIGFVTMGDGRDHIIPYASILLKFFREITGVCKNATSSAVVGLMQPPIQPCPPPNRRDARHDSWMNEPARGMPILGPYVGSLLKRRFHRFDKSYKNEAFTTDLRLTKEQFHKLILSIGGEITRHELELLWNSMPPEASGKWHYRQIMRHFILMGSPKRDNTGPTRNRKNFNPIATEFHKDRLRDFRKQLKEDKAEEIKELLIKVDTYETRPDTNKPISEETKNRLIQQIYPIVSKNFKTIRDIFREVDMYGYCYVDYPTILKINRQYDFGLSHEDVHSLCRAFDVTGKGKFRYLEFLRKFAEPHDETSAYRYNLYTSKLLSLKTNEEITVLEIINRLRRTLLSEHRCLLTAFRKLDKNKLGYLDVSAFEETLKKSGIVLSKSDLYHLLTELDTTRDGVVDYEEFLNQMINISSTK